MDPKRTVFAPDKPRVPRGQTRGSQHFARRCPDDTGPRHLMDKRHRQKPSTWVQTLVEMSAMHSRCHAQVPVSTTCSSSPSLKATVTSAASAGCPCDACSRCMSGEVVQATKEKDLRSGWPPVGPAGRLCSDEPLDVSTVLCWHLFVHRDGAEILGSRC